MHFIFKTRKKKLLCEWSFNVLLKLAYFILQITTCNLKQTTWEFYEDKKKTCFRFRYVIFFKLKSRFMSENFACVIKYLWNRFLLTWKRQVIKYNQNCLDFFARIHYHPPPQQLPDSLSEHKLNDAIHEYSYRG